jgi:hypothetical protein
MTIHCCIGYKGVLQDIYEFTAAHDNPLTGWEWFSQVLRDFGVISDQSGFSSWKIKHKTEPDLTLKH